MREEQDTWFGQVVEILGNLSALMLQLVVMLVLSPAVIAFVGGALLGALAIMWGFPIYWLVSAVTL